MQSSTLNNSVAQTSNVAQDNPQTNISQTQFSNTNTSHSNISNSNTNFSSEIDRLWGSVLLEIKKRNMFALSSSLKDIYGVHMVGNCLVLKTNDQSVLKTIDEPTKLDVILSIASSINEKIKRVEIHYDESNKSSKDIATELKNIFMNKLKIKE